VNGYVEQEETKPVVRSQEAIYKYLHNKSYHK